jgi:hypothetical protein
MTQEDKDLLLKDLCARLPYGVKAILSEYHIDEFPYNGTYCDKVINLGISEDTINLLNHIEKYGVRPYLRPLSSMTEEEKEELKEIGSEYLAKWENVQDSIDKWRLDAEVSYKRSEFYNSHLLDWRGLIPKGLALEAPDGMYNLNK